MAPPLLLAGVVLVVLNYSAGTAAQNDVKDCEEVVSLAPRPSQVLSDARPLIAWSGRPGLENARLELVSRNPEAEVLQRMDSQASGGSFRPTQPLASYRANVTVSLMLPCRAANPSDAGQVKNLRFYIDTGLGCAPPGEFSERRTGTLGWDTGHASTAIEIAFFSFAASRHSQPITTRGASLDLPGDLERPAIAVARSLCGVALSAPAFAYIPR